MPTPTKGPRLGGSPAHERIILANLASQLFEHGKVTTTEARAKRVQPLAERLISKAKRGDLHNRRQVMSVVGDKTVVHVLFTEIAPQMAERDGGYTRITKIGNRKGDNAPMAVLELVTESVQPKKPAAKKRTSDAAAAKPEAAQAQAVDTEVAEVAETETKEESVDTVSNSQTTEDAAQEIKETVQAAEDQADADATETEVTAEAASDEADAAEEPADK